MSNTLDGERIKIGKTLTEENVADLSTISGFTPEKVREWHKVFLKDCPTGTLTKRKFIDTYRLFLPSGKTDKYCEHVFRSFDTDGSGDMDFGEFLIAVSVKLQQDPTKKLEWAFSMHDIDRNGYIEKEEMKRIMKAIFEFLGGEIKSSSSPDSKVDEIFLKMDTNGDGKLSKDEFITGCLQDKYLQRLLAP